VSGPPTILVVEDEPGIRETFEAWLAEDYEVVTAADGEEGLERLTDDVDVVLLDRRMPGLSGDEMLDRLRERGVDARVAMVTAVVPDADVVDMGFDAYVTKPVRGEELRTVVDRLVSRAAYDRTVQELYSAIETRATLYEELTAEERADSEELDRLESRIEELEAEVERAASDLEVEDLEVLARQLSE
jgi:DNA-binding response OmpR family regulator